LMSYKVTIEKGVSFPRFYCDVCLKPIEKLAEGNTIFSGEAPEGNTLHVHKVCDAAVGKGTSYNRWHELEIDLVYLLRRYGWITAKGKMTPEFRRAIERAEAFSGL